MAKRTIEVFHDDLDGSEGADVRTVKFGLDGKNYEIDLSDTNATALRAALEKYVAAGRVVTMSSDESGRRKYGSGPKRNDTKHIREWLRSQGVNISNRGRIPTDYMNLYNQYGAYGHDIPKERQRTAPKAAAPAPTFTSATTAASAEDAKPRPTKEVLLAFHNEQHGTKLKKLSAAQETQAFEDYTAAA